MKVRRRRIRPRPLSQLPTTAWLIPAAPLLGAMLMFTMGPSGVRPTAAVGGDTPYVVSGRAGNPNGAGHGRGMGQNDAFSQSKSGWNAERILGQAYPGMRLTFNDPAKLAVRLMGNDGRQLDVYSDAGAMVAGRRVEPGQGIHLTAFPGGAAVTVTANCGGPVVWQAPTTNPWVDPVDLGPNRPPNEILKFCRTNSPYRGSLGVALDPVPNSAGPQRVVNYLWMDDYLRGVVPMEMSASWADTGGSEALRAQAIAARSYALADKRYPYAQTCDTQDCQMYGGAGMEDPRSDAAVDSTRGVVLLRNGQIARSEYSANAAPHWTKAITASQISEAFGVGPVQSVEITSRTDNGVGGVKVVAADRTVEVSGDDARAKLGLASDDFDIVQGTEGPLAPAVAPAPPPPPAPPAPVVPPPAPNMSVTADPIEAKYQELGGADGKLGPPTGDDLVLPGHVGKFRMFKYGVVLWTPDLGAQSVDLPTVLAMFPESGIGADAGTATVPPAQPGLN